jgi:molybdopterin molybdotransferase
MAFGRIASNGRSAFLFGLPGNPVAVMVTFYHFVRGALLRMMGATETGAPLVPAISVAPIRKRPGRTEYQRGIATLNGSGQLEVRLTGQQGSGVLRSMSEANCFVVLAHEQAQVNAGDAVQILLFDGLV